MILSEKTPIQIGAVLVLGGMATGLGVFLMELSSASAVNAVEIKIHDQQIREIRQAVGAINDIKTDVAVIREKVERLDRRR